MAARQLKQKILQYAVTPRPKEPAFFRANVRTLVGHQESMLLDKVDPSHSRSVAEVANAFWNSDPAIVHPVIPDLTGLVSEGKPDPTL